MDLKPLLHARRYAVPIAAPLLSRLPERSSRAALTRVLRRCPQLWGWSPKSDRLRFSYDAYEQAFPCGDAHAFVTELVRTRARALGTSMVYMARAQAGRDCALVAPGTLHGLQAGPCIVAYLHYAIDPVVQLVLLAANPERDLRWVIFPTQPNEPLRWEGERALYLAGGVPGSIAGRLLSVTGSGWLVEVLAHLKRGGSVLLALDTPLEARRRPATSLRVGQATMPVSPAIASLTAISGAHLLFAWPQPGSSGTWSVRWESVSGPGGLAAVASAWIEDHPLQWAGWPYLAWRPRSTEMRRIVA